MLDAFLSSLALRHELGLFFTFRGEVSTPSTGTTSQAACDEEPTPPTADIDANVIDMGSTRQLHNGLAAVDCKCWMLVFKRTCWLLRMHRSNLSPNLTTLVDR